MRMPCAGVPFVNTMYVICKKLEVVSRLTGCENDSCPW
jgi:hypothetical protein